MYSLAFLGCLVTVTVYFTEQYITISATLLLLVLLHLWVFDTFQAALQRPYCIHWIVCCWLAYPKHSCWCFLLVLVSNVAYSTWVTECSVVWSFELAKEDHNELTSLHFYSIHAICASVTQPQPQPSALLSQRSSWTQRWAARARLRPLQFRTRRAGGCSLRRVYFPFL